MNKTQFYKKFISSESQEASNSLFFDVVQIELSIEYKHAEGTLDEAINPTVFGMDEESALENALFNAAMECDGDYLKPSTSGLKLKSDAVMIDEFEDKDEDEILASISLTSSSKGSSPSTFEDEDPFSEIYIPRSKGSPIIEESTSESEKEETKTISTTRVDSVIELRKSKRKANSSPKGKSPAKKGKKQ